MQPGLHSPIVEIECCARAIEEDVVLQLCERAHRLKPHRALLFPDSDRVADVGSHNSFPRLLATAAIRSHFETTGDVKRPCSDDRVPLSHHFKLCGKMKRVQWGREYVPFSLSRLDVSPHAAIALSPIKENSLRKMLVFRLKPPKKTALPSKRVRRQSAIVTDCVPTNVMAPCFCSAQSPPDGKPCASRYLLRQWRL